MISARKGKGTVDASPEGRSPVKKSLIGGAAMAAVVTTAALALPAAPAGAQTPAAAVAASGSGRAADAARCPWLNTHQTVARRVAEVLSRMTLSDEILMVEGQGTSQPYVFYIAANPRLCIPAAGLDLKDQVISINRVTKVVKGGKNMSFAALVVVGDEGGHVGFGTGKAREVPLAIKKAIEAAKKSLIRVPLIQNTVPHQLIGKFGAGRVLVKPAAEGTGVIAGGAVRAVMQAVGVHDVRTKVLGSTNPHNVVRATFDALLRMKDPMELARLRGKQVEEI